MDAAFLVGFIFGIATIYGIKLGMFLVEVEERLLDRLFGEEGNG